MLVALMLLGCGGEPDSTPGPDTAHAAEPLAWPEPLTAPLGDEALLRRLSLDLRGVPPTLPELDAVAADPTALEGLTEEMLADPRFVGRFADLMAEQWLTRVDGFNIGPDDYHRDDLTHHAFARMVGNEPLVFMATIAAADRPWTDVVEADFTMASSLAMELWPLEEAPDAAEAWGDWVPARYTDDRPAGGVTMTNGLWWRYYSAANNFNRSRAAVISAMLLCEDYLTRPVSFEDSSLLDQESPTQATQQVTACVGCHSTLDPLASAMFGFWWFDLYDVTEMSSYHAEREQLGEHYLGVEPAWFGQPMDSPADLGWLIAEDPRFTTCSVRRTAQALWRREIVDDDFVAIELLKESFRAGELRMSALISALVATDEYRAGSLLEGVDEDAAAHISTRRTMSPDQLADSVEMLTGFTWSHDTVPLLDDDEVGFRILAGGVDGEVVSSPVADPTLTRSLVTKRLGEAAASYAIGEDVLAEAADRRLLTLVDLDTPLDTPETSDQVAELVRRFHGEEPDEHEVAQLLALLEEVGERREPAVAWAALVSALIRDPAFWSY